MGRRECLTLNPVDLACTFRVALTDAEMMVLALPPPCKSVMGGGCRGLPASIRLQSAGPKQCLGREEGRVGPWHALPGGRCAVARRHGVCSPTDYVVPNGLCSLMDYVCPTDYVPRRIMFPGGLCFPTAQPRRKKHWRMTLHCGRRARVRPGAGRQHKEFFGQGGGAVRRAGGRAWAG
eukprot:358940-Chlamydomonas_euryale.AAC.3